MRAAILLTGAAGLLAIATPAAGQRAPGLREYSPVELYRALYYSQAGPRCYAVGDYTAQVTNRLLHQRYQKVRPWLVAQIGEKEFGALVDGLEEALHDVTFIGCPSDLVQKRDTRRRRAVLREMERRAHAKR